MKIAWIDTETTGLNPKGNACIQLSGVIDIDGQAAENFNFFFRPWTGAIIEPSALEVNRRTAEEIATFPEIIVSLSKFRALLGGFVNKYDKADKFVWAGYNARFDIEFVRELFTMCGDKYFGSWLFSPPLDVHSFVAEAVLKGLRLPDYKLTTVCAHFGINMENAHDANTDIQATRELYYRLKATV